MYCRTCKPKIEAEGYRTNPRVRLCIQASTKRQRQERRQWLFEYLGSHPCVDCGESDPIVLDFDHVTGDKLGAVPVMAINKLRPMEVVLAEIAKCKVRCANCHRRKTAQQFGYFGSVIQPG